MHKGHRVKTETDPLGKKAGEPGAKLDAGKPEACLLEDFGLALTEVARVSTFGAHKYSRGGWQHAQDGAYRYGCAMWRHLLKRSLEPCDSDSGIDHDAHIAWNALARLELRMRAKKQQERSNAS